MCKHLSDKQEKVLYVSGEESLQQIKLRGDRIGEFSDSIFLLAETNITTIEGAIDQKHEPGARDNRGSAANCEEKRNHNIYRRPCNKRRKCRWSAYAGTYGRYGVVF